VTPNPTIIQEDLFREHNSLNYRLTPGRHAYDDVYRCTADNGLGVVVNSELHFVTLCKPLLQLKHDCGNSSVTLLLRALFQQYLFSNADAGVLLYLHIILIMYKLFYIFIGFNFINYILIIIVYIHVI